MRVAKTTKHYFRPAPSNILHARYPEFLRTATIMAGTITSITSSPKVLTIKSPAKKGFVLPSVGNNHPSSFGCVTKNYQFTIPPGWTSSPLSPVYHEEWDGPDSEGQTIARCHGLQPGKPVMEDNEAWTTIFLSGNKFYIWDRMDDGIFEIVSQDICEIVRTISELELRELATKPVTRIIA